MRTDYPAIGCGKNLRVSITYIEDEVILYESGHGHEIQERILRASITELEQAIGSGLLEILKDELELVQGASNEFDHELFISGDLTPVYFGTALGNFGVDHMLDGLVDGRELSQEKASGKTEASQEGFQRICLAEDPSQHGPQAQRPNCILPIVSGKYSKGMKMRHTRIGKDVRVSDALTFGELIERCLKKPMPVTLLAYTTTVLFALAIPLRLEIITASQVFLILRQNCSNASVYAILSSKNSCKK